LKEFKFEQGRIKILFGKYKGQFLDEVETSYLKWIVNQVVNHNADFSDRFLVEVEEELKSRGEEIC